MLKQTVMRFVFLLLGLTLASGCTGLRGRRGTTPPGGSDPWEVYPEAIEGDLVSVGNPFSETHAPLRDVRFEAVLFGFDSFQVPSPERGKVEEVAQYLKSNPGVVLVVEGHCDERGSREYNLSLGEQRAQAVRAYLVNLGIAPESIQTISFGKERPVDPGHNEAAWRLNRRVEFVFYR